MSKIQIIVITTGTIHNISEQPDIYILVSPTQCNLPTSSAHIKCTCTPILLLWLNLAHIRHVLPVSSSYSSWSYIWFRLKSDYKKSVFSPGEHFFWPYSHFLYLFLFFSFSAFLFCFSIRLSLVGLISKYDRFLSYQEVFYWKLEAGLRCLSLLWH